MSEDFRIGQVVAGDVAPGDVLINVPHDQGGTRRDQASVIGTVLHVHVEGEKTRSWTMRAGHRVFQYPEKPVPKGELTYVHVPWSRERRAVQPTVDGIRGHQVTTPEEDAERLRLTLAMPDCPECWAWSDRNPNARPRPLAVGDHVRFRQDEAGEGVGIVRQVRGGDVWVETSCNTWRGYPASLFARTTDPLPKGLEPR